MMINANFPWQCCGEKPMIFDIKDMVNIVLGCFSKFHLLVDSDIAQPEKVILFMYDAVPYLAILFNHTQYAI